MKPTVITSGNSENPANHPDGSGMNSTGNTPHPANGGGTGNSSARQFPQFQSGFGFDPYLDDIFSDPAIRSRLNRFRDPFAFARKRCGPNEPNDDPHSRFFDDDDSDFFPSFGSFPTRRRAPSQGATGSGLNAASGSGAPNPFYDHIPAEFRHYIPDDFGFSHGRGAPQPAPQQAPPQPVHPQQFYEAYVQPPSPTYKQPPPQKAKLCDAAIQTEDLGELDGGKEAKNLKQYGMRNTVDLGQKSPQEECRGSRSQSAPPPEGSDQTDSTSTASNSQKTYPAAGGACAQQAPEFQPPQQQTQTFNQQASKGTQPMTPPHPPPRQPTTNQQYQPWRGQPQYQQPQYEQQQQETNSSQTGGGFTRTVPIFFEGRAEPMTKRTAAPPRQNQQQSQKPKPDHPTPLNVQQQPPQQTDNQAPPPQTPHTTECINKIQGIQRDVLDLMAKVEQFTGIKNDKEYMFLDEMLTRNLLKLDTIDTNGKDNIRLARREAIKCIQASINVLEAKAEENAKTANSTVMVTSPQSETEGDQDRAEVGEQKVMEEEPINIPSENVAIPLPAPPAKETPTTEVSSADVENKIENKKDIENVVDEKGKIEEQVETTKETAEKIPEQPLIEKIESKDNKENIENPEIKDESTESSQQKSENKNVGGETKTGEGVVKKKIIKKKKIGTDKKDKSDSVSPAEKSVKESEVQAENAKQDNN